MAQFKPIRIDRSATIAPSQPIRVSESVLKKVHDAQAEEEAHLNDLAERLANLRKRCESLGKRVGRQEERLAKLARPHGQLRKSVTPEQRADFSVTEALDAIGRRDVYAFRFQLQVLTGLPLLEDDFTKRCGQLRRAAARNPAMQALVDEALTGKIWDHDSES